MSSLFVMMLALPVAGVVFAGMWVAWWLTADYLSTDRSIGTTNAVQTYQRRHAARILAPGEQLRIAR